MLALYYFGPMIERYLGSRRYLAFYLICGVSGAVMYLLLLYAHILNLLPLPMVGASAGILGVLIAAARVAPNTTVMLLFPPIPMRLRMMAWIFVGIAVITVLQNGQNAGGEAGHLGGAAMGFLLIQRPQLLNFATFSWFRRRPKGGSWKMDDWR
jgi:membrane associated rhomboid family serine protease